MHHNHGERTAKLLDRVKPVYAKAGEMNADRGVEQSSFFGTPAHLSVTSVFGLVGFGDEQSPVRNHPQREHVERSGLYPASGELPKGTAELREQGELGHPEERRPRLLPSARDTRPNACLLGFGRALFGGFFLYNGINHFVSSRELSAYARSKEIPFPGVAVLASGAMLLAGGLSLVTGRRPRIGASLIGAFLAGVSPQMHAFWTIDDDEQRGPEMINFTKNMALLGGACLAAAIPEPWPARLGRRLERP